MASARQWCRQGIKTNLARITQLYHIMAVQTCCHILWWQYHAVRQIKKIGMPQTNYNHKSRPRMITKFGTHVASSLLLLCAQFGTVWPKSFWVVIFENVIWLDISADFRNESCSVKPGGLVLNPNSGSVGPNVSSDLGTEPWFLDLQAGVLTSWQPACNERQQQDCVHHGQDNAGVVATAATPWLSLVSSGFHLLPGTNWSCMIQRSGQGKWSNIRLQFGSSWVDLDNGLVS